MSYVPLNDRYDLVLEAMSRRSFISKIGQAAAAVGSGALNTNFLKSLLAPPGVKTIPIRIVLDNNGKLFQIAKQSPILYNQLTVLNPAVPNIQTDLIDSDVDMWTVVIENPSPELSKLTASLSSEKEIEAYNAAIGEWQRQMIAANYTKQIPQPNISIKTYLYDTEIPTEMQYVLKDLTPSVVEKAYNNKEWLENRFGDPETSVIDLIEGETAEEIRDSYSGIRQGTQEELAEYTRITGKPVPNIAQKMVNKYLTGCDAEVEQYIENVFSQSEWDRKTNLGHERMEEIKSLPVRHSAHQHPTTSHGTRFDPQSSDSDRDDRSVRGISESTKAREDLKKAYKDYCIDIAERIKMFDSQDLPYDIAEIIALVDSTYIQFGNRKSFSRDIEFYRYISDAKALKKRLPKIGYSEIFLEHLYDVLAYMEKNLAAELEIDKIGGDPKMLDI